MPKFFHEIRMQDTDGGFQAVWRDRGADLVERQMRGGQRHPQAATDQHHDDLPGLRVFCKEFGMAGEGDMGLVDDALVYGRSDHGVEGSAQTAVGRSGQCIQHILAVDAVELTCRHSLCAGLMQYVQRAVTRMRCCAGLPVDL